MMIPISVAYAISGIVIGSAFEYNERIESGSKGWGVLAGVLWPVTILMMFIFWVSGCFEQAAIEAKRKEAIQEELEKDPEETITRVNSLLAEMEKIQKEKNNQKTIQSQLNEQYD